MRTSQLYYLLPALLLPGLHAEAQNCTSNPTLCNLAVQSTINQADLEVAIDVVLVGDGFTSASAFAPVAAGAISQFQGAAAGIYSRVPNLFNFHVVSVISTGTDVGNSSQTDTALGMIVSGPFITADMGRVNLAALNAPDVDVVITIANSGSGRANANYNSQLASGGSIRLSSNTGPITHEIGHAVFHLSDEYEESGLCSGTPSESLMLTEANATAEGTCYKWQGLAGASCIQGNRYCSTGAWRSASGCLMRSSGGAACPVCSHEIDEVLAERRTQSDLAPPWVITSRVGGTGSAAGQVSFVAQAHDDFFSPIDFAFLVDGSFIGEARSAFGSASLPYDTTRLSDGPHTLVAYASDALGHSRASLAQTFTVTNTTDTTAPTLAINSPAQNAVLSGTAFVSVSATGQNSDISEIRLFLDALPVAVAVGTSSLFYRFDTTLVALGAHQLTATAVDYAQNTGSATPVNVVTSTGSAQPPQLAPMITEPNDGDTVGPVVFFQWTVGEGVAQGGSGPGGGGGPAPTSALLLDNVLVTPNPLAGVPAGFQQEVILDASAWALGPHQLRVRATLGALVADSPPVLVVRGNPTTPVVYFRGPPPGTTQRGTVSIPLIASDNAPITSIAVFADGTAIGTISGPSGAVSFNTTARPPGCVTLTAEALSSDGGRAQATPRSLCFDNVAPTASIGSPHNGDSLPPGMIAVRVDYEEVGSGIADVELLVDGTSAMHTSDGNGRSSGLFTTLTSGTHVLTAVVTDRAGNRVTTAPVSISIGACTAQSCDDQDSCTVDRCAVTGVCVHARTGACCTIAADCNDGDSCTTESCNLGVCGHAPVAGCCNHDFDCADADSCTQDQCSGPGGTCSHPAAGCCTVPADCNDGNTCTADSCIGGACAHDRTPGCCSGPADCDDGNACTADSCSGGTCTHSAVANCCRTGADCSDGNNCTFDLCDAQHQCQNPPIQGCCAVAADCATANPCSQPVCGPRGQCANTTIAGCCNFDFECTDAQSCTDDSCVSNVCAHPVSPLCCQGPADCGDNDPCTADLCSGSRCSHPAIAGCCRVNADCDDGNACTTEECSASHQCVTISTNGCPDAGVPVADAGFPGPDAGPGADAAEPLDLGFQPDAAEVPDAGPGADAFEPVDVGPLPDAAEPPDAGPGADAFEPLDLGFFPDAAEVPDAGPGADAFEPLDLGFPPADSGQASADTGPASSQPRSGVIGSSCGCETSPGGARALWSPAALLGLVVWLRRRRLR